MNSSDSGNDRQLLEALAQEKKLIGYDLHDGIVQLLVGTLLQLESIKVEQLDDKTAQKIHDSKSHLTEALHQVRKLVRDLAASTIESGYLEDEISGLVQSASQEELLIDLQIADRLDDVEPLLGGSLYRIVQEVLTNVSRHSQATQAIIKISKSEEAIRMTFLDNGIGIESDWKSKNRLGLLGIQSRAAIFGGEVQIESSRMDPEQFQQRQLDCDFRSVHTNQPLFQSGSIMLVKIPRNR